MTDFHVYHLVGQRLEAVLPALVTRARARGWRTLVKVAETERMRALDDHLWAYSDESFLPHGTDLETDAAQQPVLLTTADGNPNAAAMLFVVDGAKMPADLAGFERVALVLDGGDDAAVAATREVWRAMKAAGHAVTYHQQDDDGRWTKRA